MLYWYYCPGIARSSWVRAVHYLDDSAFGKPLHLPMSNSPVFNKSLWQKFDNHKQRLYHKDSWKYFRSPSSNFHVASSTSMKYTLKGRKESALLNQLQVIFYSMNIQKNDTLYLLLHLLSIPTLYLSQLHRPIELTDF